MYGGWKQLPDNKRALKLHGRVVSVLVTRKKYETKDTNIIERERSGIIAATSKWYGLGDDVFLRQEVARRKREIALTGVSRRRVLDPVLRYKAAPAVLHW